MIPLVLALFLNITGMACLALSMERHHRRVWGTLSLSPYLTRIRYKGWALLACGYFPCMTGWGPGIGAVIWMGLLTPAIITVATFLATPKTE